MSEKKFSNVAEGLFSNANENTKTISTKEKKEKVKPKINKVGRPVSKDIKEGEETLQTSIYLTEKTRMQIDIFAIKNKMDRSEAVRYLIRKYIDNNVEI